MQHSGLTRRFATVLRSVINPALLPPDSGPMMWTPVILTRRVPWVKLTNLLTVSNRVVLWCWLTTMHTNRRMTGDRSLPKTPVSALPPDRGGMRGRPRNPYKLGPLRNALCMFPSLALNLASPPRLSVTLNTVRSHPSQTALGTTRLAFSHVACSESADITGH